MFVGFGIFKVFEITHGSVMLISQGHDKKTLKRHSRVDMGARCVNNYYLTEEVDSYQYAY